MKKIRNFLINRISRLLIWIKNFDKVEESSVISLAPKVLTKDKDIKLIQPYLDELERGLGEKGITNIAITGSYGSGKSTVIKTFLDIHKEYQYINISLASFSDNDENGKKEKQKNEEKENQKKEEIEYQQKKGKEYQQKKGKVESEEKCTFNANSERRLEISILQQLFYHVKPSKIPDSRFKRIKNNKWWKLILFALCMVLWLISILFLFKFDYLDKIDPSTWNIKYKINWIAFLSSVVFFLGIGFLAKYIKNLFSNSKINKISIKGEIELANHIDKSVFNEHLEEIIYFFERTPYNVIVIEDLDRFNTTDIFTKLRELNILLNSTKIFDREINFIYAIKDELFTDKNERVKFFDYIIPIIPFINASNAGVKLNELIETRQLEKVLSNDFIQDIVSFIDDIDMRLLINIFHEFCIYREVIPVEKPDNLFAIIVYKNMYPEDFGKLSKREGDLYKFISNKKAYSKSLDDHFNIQINKLKEQIDDLKKETVESEKVLRAIYINAIHELIPNAIFLLVEKMSFNELNNDEQFEKIRNNNSIEYWYFNEGYGRVTQKNSGLNFSLIEKHVNSELSYDNRLQNIRDKKNNKVDQLKKEIENLEKKKQEIEKWSLQEIFQEVEIDLHLGIFSSNSMLRSLIINGYLNEDYEDYITLFHEGNITRTDEAFKRKVKSGIVSPFEYPLSDKVANLIKGIPDKYFNRSVILNYDLLDFISVNYKQYNSKFDDIISVLSNEKVESVKFIKGYIERGNYLPLFVQSLCHSWKNWWYFIIESDKQIFTDEILKKYSKLIIENAKVDDILNFNRLHLFQNYVNQKSDFIYLFEKQTFRNILEVLKKLEIKFEKIDNPDENNLFFLKFIYENNLYQINIDNITLMLDFFGSKKDLQNMIESNYSTILDSGCSKLINYIEYDINKYINNVFLKLEHNSKEKQKNIIKLLNNIEINIVTKTDIILKQDYSISYLTEISDVEVMQMLFNKNKINVNWDNIFHYYETLETDSDLDEVLVNFLNKEENYKLLNNQKIATTLIGQSEEVLKRFFLKIIYCNTLNIDSYISLVELTPYTWNSLSFENLDRDKIEWMVKTGFLILTESNFTKLKNNFSNEHVKLMENQQEKIFSVWDEISLSEKDVLLLLRSKIIKINNKIEIIKRIDSSYIIGNKDISKTTCDILANSNRIDLSFEILTSLIKSSSDIENKVKILNIQNETLSDLQLTILIESLGGKYPELFLKQHKPNFSNTSFNETLFKNLVHRKLIKRFIPFKKDQIKAIANY